MKKILMLLAVVVTMAGCASLPPYFTNPQNTQVFAQMGMGCVLAQPTEYMAGIGYEYMKTPMGYQMAQSSLIKVLIQCGNDLYTVVCDPTKSASDNPCTGLQVWHPVAPPAAVAPVCKGVK